MLATLDVPFDTDAVAFAIGSAVELGQRLIVANFVERAPLPLSTIVGLRVLMLLPIVLGFWFVFYMPRWRRRVREQARSLRRWNLHPE